MVGVLRCSARPRGRGLALIAAPFAAFDGFALLLALGLGTVLGVLTARRSGPSLPPRYQLEHRQPRRIRVLAAFHDKATGRAALADRAAALSTDGRPGQLVLVAVTSGAVSWSVLGPAIDRPSEEQESPVSSPRDKLRPIEEALTHLDQALAILTALAPAPTAAS